MSNGCENIFWEEMKALSNLEPKSLWEHFMALCEIPRASKHEEQVSAYLQKLGEELGIETHRDAVGNILMRKPATTGMEARSSIVLQSHMDMVCEKNSDSVHDFMRDPIHPYIDGNWVRARGTTLGADDGIGCAAQLAVLTDPSVEHGPIECLFTVDEETGLTGAFALEANFFQSQILLNLDSEDEGELFIGCAGGVDTVGYFNFREESVAPDYKFFKISVAGLTGGHSGDDINKGYANSIKLLARILLHLEREMPLQIANFEGGNLRNAIPREASAVLGIPPDDVVRMKEFVAAFGNELKQEYRSTEPNIVFEIVEYDTPRAVMMNTDKLRLLHILYTLPSGVIEMSREIPGLVETSTNLASVKRTEEHVLEIATSQRSSVDSAKQYVSTAVESALLLAGCSAIHSDGYPGWAPNLDSQILQIAQKAYTKLFNTQPVVRAIHAGLECGLFLEKYPGLDMISFGPTIRGVHSPDERLDIPSTKKFWDFLLEILRNAPQKN